RLPTEAEWEYACRAGTTTPFHFGGTLSAELANYDAEYTYSKGPKGRNRAETTPVGSFAANAWGLFDMHGNVWEWCSDWFAPYPAKALTDPTGPPTSKFKVFRGGGWNQAIEFARSRNRFMMSPSNGIYFVGFRLALAQTHRKEGQK